jgi:chromosome partitioning protein
MGKTISISIFKGGTGKTTTAVNLSAALAQLGATVLLIDLDQQASATRHLGLDPENQYPSLFDVFKEREPASMAIRPLDVGFSIIPGHAYMAAIEEAMEEGDETMLKRLISGVTHDFDYIILDSPPGKAMLAMNALAAAHEVIVPLQAERPALDGVSDLFTFIREVMWDKYNPELRILGILPTMFKRTTTHSLGVVNMAKEIWGNKVFPVEIPETIAFPRSYNEGIPLIQADPEHEGARAYREVAQIIHPLPPANDAHHEGR